MRPEHLAFVLIVIICISVLGYVLLDWYSKPGDQPTQNLTHVCTQDDYNCINLTECSPEGMQNLSCTRKPDVDCSGAPPYFETETECSYTAETTPVTCKEVGGVTCPYRDFCDSLIKTEEASPCCKTFCNRPTSTGTCNFNTLCEPFEDETCMDCQCPNGVVCSGLCYRNVPEDAECINERLSQPDRTLLNCEKFDTCPNVDICDESGNCRIGGQFITFESSFPRFLELNKATPGTITVKNLEKDPINLTLNWGLYGLALNKDVSRDFSNIKLGPKGELSIPLEITGTNLSKEIDDVFGPDFSSLVIEMSPEASVSLQFFVYDKANAQKCGNYYWNYDGLCLGNVFYLEGDCLGGKTCLDKTGWWTVDKRDVKPAGNLTAVVVPINLPDLDIKRTNETLEKVRKWYDKESIRVAGSDIIDLNFEVMNNLEINYSDVDDLVNNKLPGMVDQNDYNFTILLLLDLESYEEESATGYYMVDGLITLDGNRLEDTTTAHEMAHGFGCRDLYEKRYLCAYNWHKGVMCAADWITGDMVRLGSSSFYLNDRELGNCAGEMGWGDVDNDGILDMNDDTITPLHPAWVSGIEISELDTTYGESGSILVDNYYHMYSDDTLFINSSVLETSRRLPISINASFVRSGIETPCLTENNLFYCLIYNANKPENITIVARLDNLETRETVNFDPVNYP